MHRFPAAEPPPPAVELWSDQIPFASPPIDDIRIRLSSAGQPTGLWPDRRIAAQRGRREQRTAGNKRGN